MRRWHDSAPCFRAERRGLVPLAEAYAGKSLRRLRQEAYDRFFTGIEQRFTRDQICALVDCFHSVTVSEEVPYWHFLCERADALEALPRSAAAGG